MPEIKPGRRLYEETTRPSDPPGRPRSACQYLPQPFGSSSWKRSKHTTPAWTKRRLASRVVEPLRAKNGGRTQIDGLPPFPVRLKTSNRPSEQATDQALNSGVSSRRWVRRVPCRAFRRRTIGLLQNAIVVAPKEEKTGVIRNVGASTDRVVNSVADKLFGHLSNIVRTEDLVGQLLDPVVEKLAQLGYRESYLRTESFGISLLKHLRLRVDHVRAERIGNTTANIRAGVLDGSGGHSEGVMLAASLAASGTSRCRPASLGVSAPRRCAAVGRLVPNESAANVAVREEWLSRTVAENPGTPAPRWAVPLSSRRSGARCLLGSAVAALRCEPPRARLVAPQVPLTTETSQEASGGLRYCQVRPLLAGPCLSARAAAVHAVFGGAMVRLPAPSDGCRSPCPRSWPNGGPACLPRAVAQAP